jgi:hypothetical protein
MLMVAQIEDPLRLTALHLSGYANSEEATSTKLAIRMAVLFTIK